MVRAVNSLRRRLEKEKPAPAAAPPPADVQLAHRDSRSAGEKIAVRSNEVWASSHPLVRQDGGVRATCPADFHPGPNDCTRNARGQEHRMSILESVRAEARRAPASGIAAVMAYGRGRPGLIPLWAGEGDLPTPDFIAEPTSQGAARRRNLLHLARRHPRTARGARPLLRAAFRPELFARRIPRRRLRHAGDPAGASGDRGRRRRGDLPVAGLAEFRRRDRGRRRQGGLRLPLDQIGKWLVLRHRQAVRRRDRPHTRHLRELAVEPDRLDRRSCRP